MTEAQHGGACPYADMVETHDCNTAACAPPPELVDCSGYWDVGECSHMCAPGGTRQRVFVVNTSEANGGAPCSSTAGAVEVEPCNEDSQCPVDCIGVWRDWAPCSLSCGGGEQTRSFEISSPASNGGACPEEDGFQTQSCNTQPCPVDCTGAWEDWSSCSRPCGGGTQTRGYLVLETAQLGGICTHAGATQTQDCNLQMCSVSEPADSLQLADGLIIEPDHLYTLPLSAPGSLVTISRVALDGAAYTVGRSYDGFPWEGVMPNPLSFDCDGGTAVCETYPASQSAGDAYRFSLISYTDERDAEAVLAEFLMQTTFGQTRSSIAEIVAMGTDVDSSINNWMNAQMSMPASLHRAHWRKNTNPPQAVANIAGGPSHPCATDALWHRFAFSLTDQGKPLEIRQVPDTTQYSLFVNGVGRTEVSEDFINARYNDGLSWRDYAQSLGEQGTSVLLRWPGLDPQSSSHAPGRADQVDPIAGSSILLGRLGDTLSFSDLPVEFHTEDLAELIGATVIGGGEWDGSEACGSPGEVANEAVNGHNYGIYSVIKR